MLDHDALLDLACELIARPSVTPVDAGCQALIGARLQRLGFTVHALRFGEVDNLYASFGSGAPHFCLLGHTDVVPPGPLEAWTSPPFAPQVRDGRLHGRGAADMKGAIAAFVIALERLFATGFRPAGRLSLLLTADEEGPALDGVRRVVPWLSARGEQIDYCLVGEPSSKARLGDVVRIGRRGSLHLALTVRGVQGHTAYPDQARNPIHALAPALLALTSERWDSGHALFPATSFQISNLHSGTGALNVIPGELKLHGNWRFSPATSAEALGARCHELLKSAGLDYSAEFECSGLPFVTEGGRLIEAVRSAIDELLGIEVHADCGGGTSDGRFIAPTGAQVVELGPINASIHKVDEHIALADLERLAELYAAVVERCCKQ